MAANQTEMERLGLTSLVQPVRRQKSRKAPASGKPVRSSDRQMAMAKGAVQVLVGCAYTRFMPAELYMEARDIAASCGKVDLLLQMVEKPPEPPAFDEIRR